MYLTGRIVFLTSHRLSSGGRRHRSAGISPFAAVAVALAVGAELRLGNRLR
jgi:hypothetical protein